MAERSTQPKAAYHSDDREILVGLYKWLFWRWMIPMIPRWITPNAITLAGSVCSIAAIATAWVASTSGPPWLFLVSGFLMVAYLTADNVDGPHARRTGRASPVGELLDHGLDGIASGALLICGGLVLRLDPVPLSMLVGVGSLAFTLSMWEQYRTNLLVIPAVSGTEGVTLVLGLDIVAFAFDDPPWMRYDGSELVSYSNGVLLFVMTCYAAAMVPPVIRGRKVGANPLELAPVALMIIGFAMFTVAGAHPLLATFAMALLGSDIGARFIYLRRVERDSFPLKWTRWILLLPLIPAFLSDDAAVANASVTTSIALSLAFYIFEMVRAAKTIGSAPDATNL